VAIGDIIAGYAAVVATAAALWPIWRARQAKQPQVEVQLFNTLVVKGNEENRTLFLEARNRGDHPVRVVTAGISDGHLDYMFASDHIDVMKRPSVGAHASLQTPDYHAKGFPIPPPIPGIVLPRDAGSRMLPDEAIAAILASAMKMRADGEGRFAGMSDEELSREFALNIEGKLQGWVQLSTGEQFRTEWVVPSRRPPSNEGSQ